MKWDQIGQKGKTARMAAAASACLLGLVLGIALGFDRPPRSAWQGFERVEHVETWINEQGDIYIGQRKEGVLEGPGTILYNNGDRYDGFFEGGLRSGIGKLYYTETKKTFLGEWKEDKRDGFGIYLYENGNISSGGCLSQGEWNGFQCKYDEKGNLIFAGEYVNGKKEGTGSYSWPEEGRHYTGQFSANEPDGLGTMHYSDGTSKSGVWKAEEFQKEAISGVEQWTDRNGNRYEGYRVNGNISGIGVKRWSDGISCGNFVDGWRQGIGSFFWTDANETDSKFYIGEWENDTRTGKGFYYYANGSYYIGDVTAGKRNGYGTRYNFWGSFQTGAWEDGEFQG